MQCTNIQEKLSAYIEDILSSEEKGLVDEHLKSCRRCRESLTDLKKTLKYIHMLEEVEPPAWMTEKVITRIRSEAEPKKGFFQRLFYPLHIKLPLEAAAAIFVAVITIYIFKTAQIEIKLSRAPIEEVTPQPPREEEKVSATAEAPPQVAEQPGGALSKDEPKRKALSHELSRRALSKRREEGVTFSLLVKDIATATKEMEKTFIHLGGKVIRTETLENKNILIAELDPERLKELLEKLKLIGEVKEEEVALEDRGGDIEIRIEIAEKYRLKR